MKEAIDGVVKAINAREAYYSTLRQKVKLYEDALEKISDPRKRDHREPDTYTTLGCVMHIAQEALDQGRKIDGEAAGAVKGSSDELANEARKSEIGSGRSEEELRSDRAAGTQG
jgi:hypothetical protein